MNGVGKTGQPYVEECNWTPFLHPLQKLNQNGLKTNVRPQTVKLLQENTGRKCLDVGLGNKFLDMTPEHKQQKQK